MNNKLFSISSVDFYEKDIEDLLRLKRKVRAIPCSSRSLLDFRDRIVSMAKDITLVSKPGQEVLSREIESLTNAIILSLIEYKLEEVEKNKGETK